MEAYSASSGETIARVLGTTLGEKAMLAAHEAWQAREQHAAELRLLALVGEAGAIERREGSAHLKQLRDVLRGITCDVADSLVLTAIEARERLDAPPLTLLGS